MSPSISPLTPFGNMMQLSRCTTGVQTFVGVIYNHCGRLWHPYVASRKHDEAASSMSSSFLHDQELAIQNRNTGNIAFLKKMLSEENDRTRAMITIDSLRRLCIDYHFSEEIDVLLTSIYKSHGAFLNTKFGLFDAALSFILLREGGYDVSSGIFQRFINVNGEFQTSLSTDIKGLLKLHDASHLNMGDEEVLCNAHEFTSRQLKSCLNYLQPNLSDFVKKTMEHPYHLSLQKYNAKHHLTHFHRMFRRNRAIEELALTEFHDNRIQNQDELMQFTRWWKDLRLAQELPFVRDQVDKWYMWATAILPRGPAFSKYRIEMAKVISLIYVVDDIFDLAGSPEELSLFTDVVKRWDITDAHSLPCYMQSCYFALFSVTNQMAKLVEKDYSQNPIHHFRKAWEKLFDAFMLEAKWFARHEVPTATDYLKNGIISSGVHVVLVHAFFLLGQGVTKNRVNLLERNPPIIASPAKILRLWDDLGSAKDEGQCGLDGSYKDYYMSENPSSSPDSVNQHIMSLISKAWEELNKECFSTKSFPPIFQEVSLNFARMVRVMYSYDEKKRLPILEEYANHLLL